MLETSLRNQIEDLQRKIKTENEVSAKVREFIQLKKEKVEKMAGERENLKDENANVLEKEIADIEEKKEEVNKEMHEKKEECEKEEELRKAQDAED